MTDIACIINHTSFDMIDLIGQFMPLLDRIIILLGFRIVFGSYPCLPVIKRNLDMFVISKRLIHAHKNRRIFVLRDKVFV